MTGDDRDADTLNRFRHLPRSLRILRTRLRLAVAIVLGVAAFLLLPGNIRTVSRPKLPGGNLAWTYMIESPFGQFAIFVGHVENGIPHPFEVWVNGNE